MPQKRVRILDHRQLVIEHVQYRAPDGSLNGNARIVFSPLVAGT